MNKDKIITISVAKDFSVYPGARYRNDGDFSGQQFYEDLLKPKFSKIWNDSSKKLEIDFDDTYGYASSFISEIFTSLVKEYEDKKKIKKKLIFKSNDDPFLEKAIVKTIDDVEIK